MKKTGFNSRLGRACRGHCGGMTLIEVLIALALFSIIAIVFVGGLSTASKAVLTADVRTRAESLARTQMEYIKSQNYTSTNQSPWRALYYRISGIPSGYEICSVNTTLTTNLTVNCGSTPTLHIIAVAWNSTTNRPASGETGLQKITLVIRHGGREVTRLEGYKVDR